jgi:hypothetical protein
VTQTARLIDSAKKMGEDDQARVVALWIAAREPRTPLNAFSVAEYASYSIFPPELVFVWASILSVLVIVLLGIMLAVRLVPKPLVLEFRDLAYRPEGNRGAELASLRSL